MSKFLTEKKPIKIVADNHKDWLSLRKGIGSSDVATILGCNKWSTPYQLWLDKTGQSIPQEEDNVYFKRGHQLEPLIANIWEEETGKHIIPESSSEYLYVHPEYDFIRASPDREFGIKKSEGILECKSTQMQIEADELPEYWFCQVQWQMGISQIEYSNIAWLIRGLNFGYAEVHFNPDFFAYMVEEVKKFWYDNVLSFVAPECSNATDIALKYKTSTDKSLEAGDNLLSIYSELKELKDRKSEIESREQFLKEVLQLNMRDCSKLTYNGETLCTWKTAKSSLKFDEKSFKKAHPEMYQEFLLPKTGSRPFLLK